MLSKGDILCFKSSIRNITDWLDNAELKLEVDPKLAFKIKYELSSMFKLLEQCR